MGHQKGTLLLFPCYFFSFFLRGGGERERNTHVVMVNWGCVFWGWYPLELGEAKRIINQFKGWACFGTSPIQQVCGKGGPKIAPSKSTPQLLSTIGHGPIASWMDGPQKPKRCPEKETHATVVSRFVQCAVSSQSWGTPNSHGKGSLCDVRLK